MLKEIIAPVLQYTIKEYQVYSVPEIIKYINADSIADDVPVDDLPVTIEGAVQRPQGSKSSRESRNVVGRV